MILYDLYWWKYELNGLKTVTFCVSFQFLTMFYTIVGAVGAGAASRYASGSDQKMRLRLRNFELINVCLKIKTLNHFFTDTTDNWKNSISVIFKIN
jgi:hypothetical protein